MPVIEKSHFVATMKNSIKFVRLFGSITAVVALLAASPAFATSDAWVGLTDGTWATSANWLTAPATVPGTGDTATFNAAGNGHTTIDLGSGVTIGNVLFDTANAAAYTIGSGGVGIQTLTLDNAGAITLNSGVANNQLANANLALPVTGTYNLVNNSASSLTIAGGLSATSTGIKVLTVDGTGNTTISGAITSGSGTVNLVKTNSGTLTLSGGARWDGNGVNCYLPGSTLVPADLRQGTTIISNGTYTNNGEFVIGGVIANGGVGNNVNLTLNGGSLGVGSWFSLGRGNGIGGVSSDLVLNNSASVSAQNMSCGFNANSANLPKGTVTLNNSSSLNLLGNGALNFAESSGSAFTMTLNGTSKFIGTGTGQKNLGYSGLGTVTLNDSSQIQFGNAICYVGHDYGTGVVTVASANAVFNNAGELQIGGSSTSGTGPKANGTFIVNAGTVGVGTVTIGRGNNNQNGVNGVLYINGGTFTCTNDVLIGFAGAGTTSGRIAMNGGTLNVGTTATKWLRFGQYDYTSGAIDITNGNLNLNTGTSIKYNQNGSTGPKTFSQYGGNVTFYSDFATTPGGSGNLDLMLSSTPTGTNTYNLNGGTLSVPQIISSSATGSRIFNFNGGKLVAVTPVSPFFASGAVTVANVRDGGAIIDSGANSITIGAALVHSTIGGDATTDGGLTKLGAGTLTLSGGYSYSGATKVLGGALSLNSSLGVPSPGGDLVVSNATLTLDASGGTPMPANNVSVGSTLNLTLNPTAYAINATGNLTLGANTTINLTYGLVTSNPNAAVINASGSLTKGTNIVINISATGLGTGVIPLITVGTGTVTTNGFALVSLPPGIKAVLTNSTSTSLDLLVTSAGQLLSWHGANLDNSVVLSNWDINTSSNWYDAALNLTRYRQYSGNTIGDNVIFGDNGYNTDGTNHVNLAVTLVPATVAFSSSSPYTLTGAGGIGGATAVVLTNMNNSVFLGTSNSYTGGTVVGGGTLVITGDNALGATSGGVTMAGGALQLNAGVTSSRAITVTANSTMGVVASATAQLNGSITGAGGLTKTDDGTLTLAGNSTYTGPTLVSAGRVNLTGAATPGYTTVGSASGNAVLNISGNLTSSNLFVGNVSGAVGAVYQTAGTVTLSGGTGDLLNLGNTDGSFGYYNAMGGTMNINGISIGGENNPNVWPPAGNGSGIMEVNGATINNIGWIVLARGSSTQTGVLNVNSGSLTYSGGGIGCNWTTAGATDQSSIINILGGSVTSTNQGVNFRTPNIGIVNLNGGVLQGTSVTGYGMLNFNGGTLRPAAAYTTPFLNLNSNVYVYSGGAVIDDNGMALTISQPLLAPTGYGLNSAFTISDPGAGYIAPPIVTITSTDGNGAGATAIAQINRASGIVTGIILTCPGFGYTAAPTVALTGGGATGQASVTGSLNAGNTSGGLTKLGSGSLTLSATNTYTGTTIVGQGTLILTPTRQETSGAVVVSNATTLALSVLGNGVTRVGNLTAGTASTDLTTLSFRLSAGTNPVSAVLECGTLTLNGTNTINVSGLLNPGTFPLLKHTGAIAGSGYLNPAARMPHGYSGVVSNDLASSTIYVTISGSGGIVWQGYSADPARTNLWDIDSSTNWLSGLSSSTYSEGDKVIFNDTGSGLVLLSNTVSPATVLISNATKTYTLQGSGHISGATGLAKTGAGTATMSYVGNDYTGPTTINAGSLSITGGSAIGDSSAVTLANVAGANLTVNASETIGSLAGGGSLGGNVILAGGSTLTAGANNASTTFGGTVTGDSIFSMMGTGTLTLTGLVNVSSEFWVGQAAGDSPVLNIQPGASVTANSWWVVGRNGAAGTVNINGGSLVHAGGGNITLGTLGTTPSGTINLYSGSISNLVGETYLGEGSSTLNYGIYKQTGGSAYLGNFYVGRGASAGQGIGTATVSGGTLIAGNIEIGYGYNNTRVGTNTFTMGAGAVVTATNYVRVGYAGSATMLGTLTNNGGILNVGATALYLGYWDPCGGIVTLNSGQINLRNNAPIIFGAQYNNSGTSTFNQLGGNVTFYSDDGTTVGGAGSLNMCNAGYGTYTYNLNGGTLTVPSITVAGGTGTTTFNFNGGTLKAAASSTNFMQGLTAANVNSPGAIIDTTNLTIAVEQALLDGDGGGGGLAKNGSGTLLLNGVNTYTGLTTVNVGTLGGTGTIAGAVTVKSGASLAPGGSIGTLTINGNLTLSAGSTNTFEVDGTTPANDAVVAGASVTYGGVLKIVPTGTFTAGQSFTLFSGAGAVSASNFASVQSSNFGLVFSFADGVLTVVSVSAIASNPTNITYSVSGSTLTLSWPADHLGWLAQSNSVGIAASNSWYNIPGSDSATTLNVNLDPAKPEVFYRLLKP